MGAKTEGFAPTGDNPPSLFHLLPLEQQIHWHQTQYHTTSTMLDSRSGVFGVKGMVRITGELRGARLP